MRIAFISYDFFPFKLGGVPLYMGGLVNQLSMRSEVDEIKVFTAYSGYDIPTNEFSEKVEIIPVKFSKRLPKFYAFGKAAYKEMKLTYESLPDLVHSTIHHGWKVLDYNRPMIATFFEVLFRFRPMLNHYDYSLIQRIREDIMLRARNHFEEKFCRKVSNIVTVSKSIKHDISKYYDIPTSKISTILGTGIDTQRFRPSTKSAEEIREKLPSSEHIVLTVTNFEPIKGIHFLVKAMQDVLAEFPHTHFLFVGEGTQREELQKIVAGHGLQDSAIFTGHVNHNSLPDYYNIADIFVRPSLWEGGTGFAFLESLACGTPVIGTNVGGIPEVVPPSCGLLVPPADHKSLANAINKLLSDNDLRRKMADAGPLHVKQNFTWDIIADKYFEVYENMLSE